MLTKRVYEIDPLACPNCGGTMKVVAFLEPPQADVIEKILRHCGLWHATRAPPGDNGFVHAPDGHSQADSDAPWDLTFVAEDAIWAYYNSLTHPFSVTMMRTHGKSNFLSLNLTGQRHGLLHPIHAR